MRPEQLCISGGFASSEEGVTLSEEEQWSKVRRLVEVAEEVWGVIAGRASPSPSGHCPYPRQSGRARQVRGYDGALPAGAGRARHQ